MPATFVCPVCRASFTAPLSLKGASSNCMLCGAPVASWIPVEESPDPAPAESPRERAERPFGGDWLFFAIVLLTVPLPIFGIVGGLIEMGGRTARRRSMGLGLLLFALVLVLVYGLLLRH